VLCFGANHLTEIVARSPPTDSATDPWQFGEFVFRRSTLMRDRVSHNDDSSENVRIAISALQSRERSSAHEELACALDAFFGFCPRQKWCTFCREDEALRFWSMSELDYRPDGWDLHPAQERTKKQALLERLECDDEV
jgi:hypothetical protein